jgi:hypothetical protein
VPTLAGIFGTSRLVIALAVSTVFAGCGVVTGTPPPRFEAIRNLMEPGGVGMEFIDPSQMGGLPISRGAAEAAARTQHAVRGPGEREPVADHLETWAASVTVTPRPGIPGGTHTAWLVALVEPGGIAAELVIVDAASGAVLATDSSPLGTEFLPGDWQTSGP